MSAETAQINVYSLAYEALSFPDQPAEPRNPGNAEQLADRYTEALRVITRAHVDDSINPPLPREMSGELLELFESYNVVEGRSVEPKTTVDFDAYRLNGFFVQSHKEMFGRIVEHGLASLPGLKGGSNG